MLSLGSCDGRLINRDDGAIGVGNKAGLKPVDAVGRRGCGDMLVGGGWWRDGPDGCGRTAVEGGGECKREGEKQLGRRSHVARFRDLNVLKFSISL